MTDEQGEPWFVGKDVATALGYSNVSRTVTDEQGEPWFVGKDVAVALGYQKARNALSSHVEVDDKKDALIQGPLGGRQKMTNINESGLYVCGTVAL